MSAIWGIINLDQREIKNTSFSEMEKVYRKLKINRFNTICKDNAAFGSGIQFITSQSKNENLPFFDSVNHNLFTTDCFLDNRTEILAELKNNNFDIGIDYSLDDDTPDGLLIYLSYLKWGLDLCDHLLGVFAIAIYNYDDNNFYLLVDHCGDRCVHYYLKNNTIFFSTIIEPIQAANNYNINISEKYIAACESNMSADMVIYPGMSPYEEVWQLLAASILKAGFYNDSATIKMNQYWNPIEDVKPLKLSSDDEYKKLFLETYRKCVTDTLRADGNTASFLSSGLDSSSVTSLAALELLDRGEALYTYTSVPLKSYTPQSGSRLEDESAPVKKFCVNFENIIPSFISCEGKSALTEMERFVNMFNAPIKYSVNAVWLDEIYKTAAHDGCKLILKGQHGNSSVSYGSLISRLWYEFKGFHLRTMIDQYRDFSHSLHVNRKLFVNNIFSGLKNLAFPKVSFEDALTKKELLKKYSLKKEYIKRARYFGEEAFHSELQRKRSIFMPNSFQQVSYTNAILELNYGIIARDPTRDKRIIELCIALPISCFADGHYERRLITDYMKDIVPQNIIRQMYNRGLQSADFIYRIHHNTKDFTDFFEKNKDLLSDYISDTDYCIYDSDAFIKVVTSLNKLALLLFIVKKRRDI